MPSDQFHRVEKLTGECEQWREIGQKDNPSFENSWVNWDTNAYTASATVNTAGFYKDPFGVVHLKGMVKTGTTGTSIFTLPEGYRPPLLWHYTCLSNSAGGGHGDTNAVVYVDKDGKVYASFSGGGGATRLCLDQVVFHV